MNDGNQNETTGERFRREWSVMTLYERFEQVVAVVQFPQTGR